MTSSLAQERCTLLPLQHAPLHALPLLCNCSSLHQGVLEEQLALFVQTGAHAMRHQSTAVSSMAGDLMAAEDAITSVINCRTALLSVEQ